MKATDIVPDDVERLFLAGQIEAALAAVTGETLAALTWRRRLLANLGRFEEAAAVGAAALAAGANGGEDGFRQAEILARLGRWRQALDAALTAAAVAPADPRPLTVAVGAALADPALMPELRRWCAARADTTRRRQRPPDLEHPRILLPAGRHLHAATDADHPDAHATLISAAGVVSFTACETAPIPPAAAIAEGLDDCERAFRGLLSHDSGIDRAVAARYVGDRALSLSDNAHGAVLDLLPLTPMTVGQRPFLLLFDLIANLFHPFLPFSHMTVSGAHSAWGRIVRAWLESPYCVGVYAPYAGAGELLGRFFDSPVVAAKTVMVDYLTPDAARWRPAAAAARPDRRADGPPTLLFSASAVDAAAKFLLRGGVYALCAFQALADRFPDLRLVMRSPLPPQLNKALMALARSHPRITVIEQSLDAADYAELFAAAAVFMSPSAALHMNSTLNAMRFGAVPVISDVFGADELVRHGKNGLLVPTAAAARVDNGALEQDFRTFRCLDGPGDPVFFRNYCDALAGLLADPERLRTMSRQAAADVAADLPYRQRGEPMSSILERGVERAVKVLRTDPPLFPTADRQAHGFWNVE